MIKTWRITYLHNATKQNKFQLTKTMWSKIFNHIEFIKTLYTKDILDNMNNLPCNSTTSPFTDPNHGHAVTGVTRILRNNKLRKITMQRSQIQATSFFSICVFLHKHSRITGQQGKAEGIYLTPLYHFRPLHRHLYISRTITAEDSPLHIASSRNGL